MTVKIKLADGRTELFETKNYMATKDNMHPLILRVDIFTNGKRILKLKRSFAWWYKHVTFKSPIIQEQLKKIEEQEKKEGATNDMGK